MKKTFQKLLTRIPYIRYAYWYKHNSSFRPGHYYSPVANVDDLKEREADIWAPRSLDGVDLNETEQIEFLKYLLDNEAGFGIPSQKDVSRFYYGESPSYQYVDGIVLYAMMAKYRPKNVIEVGSGASTGCMMDASNNYGLGTSFTLIEPNPQVCLEKVLGTEQLGKSGVNLIADIVQKVPPGTFKKLQRNDVLFIDSTHVSKPGSDVNYLLTQVLPILNEGVIIHFHDIYYPFEYTREYLLNLKLLWSEVYSLHNFLLFNNAFKIIFFSDQMWLKIHDDPAFATQFSGVATSLYCNNTIRPKSLWIQRTKK